MSDDPAPVLRPRFPVLLSIGWGVAWLILLPFSFILATFAQMGANQTQSPSEEMQVLIPLLLTVSRTWPVACVAAPPLSYLLWRYGPRSFSWGLMCLPLMWLVAIGWVIWLGTKD